MGPSSLLSPDEERKAAQALMLLSGANSSAPVVANNSSFLHVSVADQNAFFAARRLAGAAKMMKMENNNPPRTNETSPIRTTNILGKKNKSPPKRNPFLASVSYHGFQSRRDIRVLANQPVRHPDTWFNAYTHSSVSETESDETERDISYVEPEKQNLEQRLPIVQDASRAAHAFPSIASASGPLSPIQGDGVVPGEFDILCGRDKRAFNHIGNKRFRVIITTHCKQYQETASRNEKTRITTQIINNLRQVGCRFLRKNEVTNMYEDMDDEYAHEKVSHALRSAKTAEKRSKRKGRKSSAVAMPTLPENSNQASYEFHTRSYM